MEKYKLVKTSSYKPKMLLIKMIELSSFKKNSNESFESICLKLVKDVSCWTNTLQVVC